MSHETAPSGWNRSVERGLRAVFGQDGDLTVIAAGVRRHDLDPGDVLFRRGDPSDAVHLVVAGRLRAIDDEDDGRVVRELGPGTLVGELGLLRDAPRSLTVVATRHTSLAVIDRETWRRLSRERPDVILSATQVLLDRLLTPSPRSADRTTRVVYVTDVHAPAATAARAHELLAAFGTERGALVTAADAARALDIELDTLTGADRTDLPGADGTDAGHRLSSWLEELEHEHDVVLLVDSATEPTGWTRRTIGQADEIVLVADATQDPTPARHEDARTALLPAAPARPRTTLVLRHPASTGLPSGTAAWLHGRDVDMHLHVRADDPASAGRAARTLFGAPVAAVLGGGGAKGFAHIGVLRAMAAHAIPIDAVIGSSMGAAMSIAVAHAWPVDEVTDRYTEIFAGLLDYTLPAVALLRGRSITNAIRDALQDRDIEDAWVPTWVMSTDLTASDEVVHSTGDHATALRASVAIPGVLPPVERDGHVLVDAGCTNNLPVDRMQQLNPRSRLVAVDVASGRGPSARDAFSPIQSGWRRLGRSMVPGMRNDRVPGAMRTLVASTVTASSRDTRRHATSGDVSLFLDLDLRGTSLLAFDEVVPVADAGEAAARDPLTAWWAEQPEMAGPAHPPSTHVGQRS